MSAEAVTAPSVTARALLPGSRVVAVLALALPLLTGVPLWAGCAMESVALSRMPPFAGKEVRLESYCACCLAPVSLATRDGDIVSRVPESVLIHVSTSPREWNTTNIVCMCDSMNYVADAEHALRYERQICRRGVLFTLEQARRFVADTAANRMWRYDWPPARVVPERIIAGIKALGVDVSSWGG